MRFYTGTGFCAALTGIGHIRERKGFDRECELRQASSGTVEPL